MSSGMEELGDVLQLADPVLGRLVVPGGAERLGRGLVDHPVREDLRDGAERGRDELERVAATLLGRQVGEPCLVAPGQHRPAQVPAPGHRVEPGDRVEVVLIAFGHPGHQVLDVAAPVGVDQEVRGLGPLQRDRGAQHGTGQTHAADGGPEQLCGLALRSQRADLAVGHQQIEGDHMVAEAALSVMVLAVHVGGDRPADRDLAGARQHRNPQTEGQHRPHQQIKADPGLHGHGGRLADGVEGQDPVHPGQIHGGAAGVLGGVAVAAAESARHHSAAVCGAQSRNGVGDGVDLRQV